MSLSRKHYQAVANILKAGYEREIPCSPDNKVVAIITAAATLDDITDRLCAYFQSDNPNFNPDTFRKAAQP